jgi:hypothetical protein
MLPFPPLASVEGIDKSDEPGVNESKENKLRQSAATMAQMRERLRVMESSASPSPPQMSPEKSGNLENFEGNEHKHEDEAHNHKDGRTSHESLKLEVKVPTKEEDTEAEHSLRPPIPPPSSISSKISSYDETPRSGMGSLKLISMSGTSSPAAHLRQFRGKKKEYQQILE